jgi:transcription termination factor Rho
MDEEKLKRVWMLRRVLDQMGVTEAMELLLDRLRRFDTNEEFLDSMNS